VNSVRNTSRPVSTLRVNSPRQSASLTLSRCSSAETDVGVRITRDSEYPLEFAASFLAAPEVFQQGV